MIRATLIVALSMSVLFPTAAFSQTEPQTATQVARALFESGDYEKALPVLDGSIPGLQSAVGDAARMALVEALQLRGRVHFALGNQKEAAEDFERVLRLDPGHLLSADVSPRLVGMVDDIRRTVVGTIVIQAEPPDAVVQVDGRTAFAASRLALVAGSHVIAATRPGYSPYSVSFVVTAGAEEIVKVALTRVSAALTLVTSPPGVEVVVNGTSRGTTAPGALPAEYADLPSRLAVAAADIALPLVLPDLDRGRYLLRFSKQCYQTVEQTFSIDLAEDYQLAPVVLKPATATLRVESSDKEATVFIDGKPRGPAPFELRDLCEGDHEIELRSPGGRYLERVKATSGGSIKVSGSVKPAFALVSVAGLPPGYRGQDLRLEVERALSAARAITLIAPGVDILKPLLASEQVLDDSLPLDLEKRRLGSAALMSSSVKRDVIRRLCQSLQVQGIAAIAVIGGESALQRMAVSLYVSGSSEPDVVLVDLQDTSTIGRALATLDMSPGISAPSLGMLAIDVSDIEGIVIAQVDAGGPAAIGGLEVGERIIQVLTERITDEASLARILEQRRGADGLPATVVGRSGAQRQVSLRPALVPRLVSVYDKTLPFNTLAADWRNRARRATADEATLLRLNLAVAAYGIGDFASARDELGQVTLKEGPGISLGTVQFLLGLVYKKLGDIGQARAAFSRASTASDAMLSDYGGIIADLARQELKALGASP